MGSSYNKEYEINYYQVDPNLNCSIESVVNILADIGTAQSEELGVGIDYCFTNRRTWVFYQYDIKINKYPSCYDKINVITNPSGFKKFYASREYSIYNKKTQEVLIEGKAIFFLIDIDKRKAIRIPEEEYKIYGIHDDNNKDITVERLEKPKDIQYSKELSVRYSDIDSNGHVNNTKYIQWAIEVLPIDFLYNHRINRLQVTFEKECKYGTTVTIAAEIRELQNGEIITYHNITSEDGKSLSTIIMYWNLK